MDRSFLSQPAVVAASRQFVCVRLATYEDPVEAKFVKGLVRTGSGELENTAFCLLSPDGAKKLTRSGREIRHIYGDPDTMAADMNRLAGTFTPKAAPAGLPTVANAKLALDVAAADGLPLVVAVGKDKSARARTVNQLARLAWADEFVGKFIYAEATPRELLPVGGLTVDAGVVVVDPDGFGLKGTVLREVGIDATADGIAAALRAAAAEFKPPEKSFQSHVREGHRQGVYWDPPVPVTDSMENAARERGRRLARPKE